MFVLINIKNAIMDVLEIIVLRNIVSLNLKIIS